MRLRTNVITASNHQSLNGNRYDQVLQTGLGATRKEGFSTHGDWVNEILPAHAQLRHNSSVRGVSLTQQAAKKRHVRTSQSAVRSYAKQMRSTSQTAHFMNGNE